MNKEAEDKLEEILAKDPVWLNEDEKGFLRARIDYLNSEHKRIFASILGSSQSEAPEPTKAELIDMLKGLVPDLDEKEAKKMKNDELKKLIAEKEAEGSSESEA